MTIQTHFITEPLLEFGSGQKLEHPQDGLFLYGPVGVPGTPQSLHVGVVGTPDGIALTQKWLTTLVGRIAANRTDQLHTSAWPGFQAAFGVKLVSNPLVKIALDGAEIFNAIRNNNRYDAVRSAVKIFEDAILNHFRVDERRPDVWLVVVPEVVHRYGRPKVVGPKEAIASTIISEKAAAEILRGGGSLFSDMTSEAQIYLFARNFHHQLKAQLLQSKSSFKSSVRQRWTRRLSLIILTILCARCKSLPVSLGTLLPPFTSREPARSLGRLLMFALVFATSVLSSRKTRRPGRPGTHVAPLKCSSIRATVSYFAVLSVRGVRPRAANFI